MTNPAEFPYSGIREETPVFCFSVASQIQLALVISLYNRLWYVAAPGSMRRHRGLCGREGGEGEGLNVREEAERGSEDGKRGCDGERGLVREREREWVRAQQPSSKGRRRKGCKDS